MGPIVGVQLILACSTAQYELSIEEEPFTQTRGNRTHEATPPWRGPIHIRTHSSYELMFHYKLAIETTLIPIQEPWCCRVRTSG